MLFHKPFDLRIIAYLLKSRSSLASGTFSQIVIVPTRELVRDRCAGAFQMVIEPGIDASRLNTHHFVLCVGKNGTSIFFKKQSVVTNVSVESDQKEEYCCFCDLTREIALRCRNFPAQQHAGYARTNRLGRQATASLSSRLRHVIKILIVRKLQVFAYNGSSVGRTDGRTADSQYQGSVGTLLVRNPNKRGVLKSHNSNKCRNYAIN